MRKLIIDKGVFFQRIAILNNEFLEYISYNLEKGPSIGDIYLGKVKSINSSNKSAFLELEEGLEAYLSDGVKDLKIGELLLVQLNKAAFGTKLPTVTRDVSLAGKNLVYLPRGESIKYSRKLADVEKYKCLIETIEGQLIEGGVIVRSGANFANHGEVLKDIEKLVSDYNSYRQIEKLSNKPRLIKKAAENYEEILESRSEAFEIVVNCRLTYKQIKNSALITENDKLELKETNLFSVYGINQDSLLGNTYEANGCEIVIENTEAMTVIDVNSRGIKLNADREKNILEINLSICSRLVQLIILKNISGIIVVDFINMKDDKHRNTLINKLKEEFKIDRNLVRVMEITSLGLVQIVRQRQEPPLIEKLTKKCSHCNGKGYEPNITLKKIQLEEKIQLLGLESVFNEKMKFEDVFTKEELILLKETYKA